MANPEVVVQVSDGSQTEPPFSFNFPGDDHLPRVTAIGGGHWGWIMAKLAEIRLRLMSRKLVQNHVSPKDHDRDLY